MPEAANSNTWDMEGHDLTGVMEEALRHLVARENRAGEGDALFRLVFSGEGGSPEHALRSAMDDIREQCFEQHVCPLVVETSGVIATDDGTRIWGTVTVGSGPPTPRTPADTPHITIREGEGGRWTITVVITAG